MIFGEIVVVVVVVGEVGTFLLFLLALGVVWFPSGVGEWFLDGLGVEVADEDSSSSIGMISSSSSLVLVVVEVFSSFFPKLVVFCFCVAILLLILVGVGWLARLPWPIFSLPLPLVTLVVILEVFFWL